MNEKRNRRSYIKEIKKRNREYKIKKRNIKKNETLKKILRNKTIFFIVLNYVRISKFSFSSSFSLIFSVINAI